MLCFSTQVDICSCKRTYMWVRVPTAPLRTSHARTYVLERGQARLKASSIQVRRPPPVRPSVRPHPANLRRSGRDWATRLAGRLRLRVQDGRLRGPTSPIALRRPSQCSATAAGVPERPAASNEPSPIGPGLGHATRRPSPTSRARREVARTNFADRAPAALPMLGDRRRRAGASGRIQRTFADRAGTGPRDSQAVSDFACKTGGRAEQLRRSRYGGPPNARRPPPACPSVRPHPANHRLSGPDWATRLAGRLRLRVQDGRSSGPTSPVVLRRPSQCSATSAGAPERPAASGELSPIGSGLGHATSRPSPTSRA